MKNGITVATEPGLACWASYLINGDASGITDDDRADADLFVGYCGGAVVSCGDDTYIGRWYGPGHANGLQCELVEYVIHMYAATVTP